ncbi:MAG: neutral/alkaline non-lysosomal ceramidase N-terminal domain-containing protein [Bacteroidales bacterium]|nr:neutral/alkaline non-lysosomal ceramidase N-terminal domain-containing protein [Bacteroidales bacterium]
MNFQTSKRKLNRFLTVIFLIIFSNFSFGQKDNPAGNGSRKEFRASVVKIDITPENSQYLLGYGARKSKGIHDHIYHRIVALDDGVTQFFLVSTDICITSPVEYDKVAAKIKSQLGISPMNLWWTVTHTHSAPEVGDAGLGKTFMDERYQHVVDAEYAALVEQKLIEGIKEARQNLSPARLGVGWGFSQANINRRAKDIGDKSSLGMDPDGPVDRRIGTLRIEKEDGTLMVLIANYPIHGTVMGGSYLEISGDAPGIVSEYVEQQIGAPLIFINGAAGNLAPLYSCYPDPQSGHLGQFRVLLGDKILDANRKIAHTTNEVILCSGSLTVETPRKPGLAWPSDFGNYTRTTNTGVNMVRLPIRFLKINEDIAIWSAPLELFCEISNEVRDRSPFPYTFYFGYTNGWLGYLLAESEYKYEGYEPTVSPYTPGAARDLAEAVVTYLKSGIQNHKLIQPDEGYIQSQTNSSLRSIRYETKPSVGIVGNSTIAAYAGGESIATLMNVTSAYNITDISVPGYTIHQEDSLWRNLPVSVKQSLDYVFVEIGLNDLKPEESASKALARYQSLINLIRTETNNSCKIITSTMTPCKQRLINLYGNTKGLISYQKWLDMNTAMIGIGPDKIRNIDTYCNSHTNTLSDGKGNLTNFYDTGDGVHETTFARQIIANEWMTKIMWYNDRKEMASHSYNSSK